MPRPHIQTDFIKSIISVGNNSPKSPVSIKGALLNSGAQPYFPNPYRQFEMHNDNTQGFYPENQFQVSKFINSNNLPPNQIQNQTINQTINQNLNQNQTLKRNEDNLFIKDIKSEPTSSIENHENFSFFSKNIGYKPNENNLPNQMKYTNVYKLFQDSSENQNDTNQNSFTNLTNKKDEYKYCNHCKKMSTFSNTQARRADGKCRDCIYRSMKNGGTKKSPSRVLRL